MPHSESCIHTVIRAVTRPVQILLGIFFLLGLATCASVVDAQELQLDAPSNIHLDVPLELQLSGENGIWFPMVTARQMLADVTELRLRQEGDRITDAERALWAERRALSDRALALAIETNNRREVLVDSLQGQLEAITARSNHWGRSRALWLTIGVVVGALGVIVAGHLLTR